MRLLLCRDCGDILAAQAEATYCYCGKSAIRQANPADTAYIGNAVVLAIKPIDLEHLRWDDDWPVTIRKLPDKHLFIKKCSGKDVGKRWGKARSRTRRGRVSAGGSTNIHTPVKMEWS